MFPFLTFRFCIFEKEPEEFIPFASPTGGTHCKKTYSPVRQGCYVIGDNYALKKEVVMGCCWLSLCITCGAVYTSVDINNIVREGVQLDIKIPHEPVSVRNVITTIEREVVLEKTG